MVGRPPSPSPALAVTVRPPTGHRSLAATATSANRPPPPRPPAAAAAAAAQNPTKKTASVRPSSAPSVRPFLSYNGARLRERRRWHRAAGEERRVGDGGRRRRRCRQEEASVRPEVEGTRVARKTTCDFFVQNRERIEKKYISLVRKFSLNVTVKFGRSVFH